MSAPDAATARLQPDGAVSWTTRGGAGASAPEGDGAPSPAEHLLAALASSTILTAARVARKRGIRLDDLRVEASVAWDERGEPQELSVRIHVTSPASEAEMAKVFESVEKLCAVSNLLAFEVDRVLVHERRGG